MQKIEEEEADRRLERQKRILRLELEAKHAEIDDAASSRSGRSSRRSSSTSSHSRKRLRPLLDSTSLRPQVFFSMFRVDRAHLFSIFSTKKKNNKHVRGLSTWPGQLVLWSLRCTSRAIARDREHTHVHGENVSRLPVRSFKHGVPWSHCTGQSWHRSATYSFACVQHLTACTSTVSPAKLLESQNAMLVRFVLIFHDGRRRTVFFSRGPRFLSSPSSKMDSSRGEYRDDSSRRFQATESCGRRCHWWRIDLLRVKDDGWQMFPVSWSSCNPESNTSVSLWIFHHHSVARAPNFCFSSLSDERFFCADARSESCLCCQVAREAQRRWYPRRQAAGECHCWLAGIDNACATFWCIMAYMHSVCC